MSVVTAIAAGLGMATQGVGTGISASSKGTAECGSKPTCISFGKNSSCQKNKNAYFECIQRIGVIKGQAVQSSFMAEQAKRKSDIKLAVIGLVAVAVILLVVVIVKRKS